MGCCMQENGQYLPVAFWIFSKASMYSFTFSAVCVLEVLSFATDQVPCAQPSMQPQNILCCMLMGVPTEHVPIRQLLSAVDFMLMHIDCG